MDRTLSHHRVSDPVSRHGRPGLAGRSSGCGSPAECPVSPLDVYLPAGTPLGQDGLHLRGGRTELAGGVQRCSRSLQVRPRGGAGAEGALHKRSLRSGTSPWGSLVGSVDIWAPLWPMFEHEAVKKRLSAGEEIWSYTALCQGRHQDTPFWELDFPILNYRIPMWISWRLDITGLLYWSTTNWASTRDVWTNPLTLRGSIQHGRLAVVPGSGCGCSGFHHVDPTEANPGRAGRLRIPQRFWRNAASRAAAEDVVKKIARSWHDWDTDARHLLHARAEIARLILAQ